MGSSGRGDAGDERDTGTVTDTEAPAGQDGVALAPTEVVAKAKSAPRTAMGPRPGAGVERHGRLSPGERVGRFVIERVLGEGGMGVVYAAADEQLKRRVAIKLISEGKSGANAERNERLLREAQAVAQLSHPNVVSVFDVGHERGEPYVAMEYVDGGTLGDWLEAEQRSWRDIVRMFVQAGRGLSAAHAAGIIHRDFKPSNVLIADGRARVVDFGLARPLGRPMSERVEARSGAGVGLASSVESEASTLTLPGEVLGTPRYMSPEQRAGKEVDVRTDQYSFCVALYEALRGGPPGREDEDERVAHVPARVDAALQRGLEIDPTKRYPTMDDLLAELGREPVPLLRRAVLVAAVLVAGGGVAFGLWWRGHDAHVCEGARDHLQGVWDETRRAEVRAAFDATGRSYADRAFEVVAERLDAFADAWVEMRTQACEATRVRGEQSADLLDRRMACLDRKLGMVRGLTEGLAGADAKLVDDALAAISRLPALAPCADREALLAAVPLPDDRAERERVLALRKELDRADGIAAAGRYREASKALEAVLEQAMTLDYAPLRAEALVAAGTVYGDADEYAKAEKTLRLGVTEAARAKDDKLAAQAWIQLMMAVGYRLNRVDEGLSMLTPAEAAVIRAGDDDSLHGVLLRATGVLLTQKGRFAEAEERFRDAYTRVVRAEGPKTRHAVVILDSLANSLADQGKLTEASEHYERALALKEGLLGPDHPIVATTLDNAGTVLADMGQFEKALAFHRRALRIWETVHGEDSLWTASCLHNMGVALSALGKYQEAEDSYRRVIAISDKLFGPKNLDSAHAMVNLGVMLTDLGRYDEAGELYDRALAIREGALGKDHPDVAMTLLNIGLLRRAQGRLAEARASFEAAIARGTPAWGEDSINLGYPLHALGSLSLQEGKLGEATELLERALRIRTSQPVDPSNVAETRFALARTLWLSKRDRRRARELAERARDDYASIGERGAEERANVEDWLAEIR